MQDTRQVDLKSSIVLVWKVPFDICMIFCTRGRNSLVSPCLRAHLRTAFVFQNFDGADADQNKIVIIMPFSFAEPLEMKQQRSAVN